MVIADSPIVYYREVTCDPTLTLEFSAVYVWATRKSVNIKYWVIRVIEQIRNCVCEEVIRWVN